MTQPASNPSPTPPDPVDPAAGRSLCPQCGADLGDLRVGRCPACGQAIDIAADLHCDRARKGRVRAATPQALDEGGPIPREWHLHCTQCGYNLTGLTSRVCPECGQAFSPRQTWLANRRSEDRSVAIRTRWLNWLPIAVFACGLLLGVAYIFVPWPPTWLLALVIWGGVELNFWRLDYDPRLPRLFFVTFFLILVLSWVILV